MLLRGSYPDIANIRFSVRCDALVERWVVSVTGIEKILIAQRIILNIDMQTNRRLAEYMVIANPLVAVVAGVVGCRYRSGLEREDIGVPHEWLRPVVMSLQFVSEPTWVGLSLRVVVPSPSCP